MSDITRRRKADKPFYSRETYHFLDELKPAGGARRDRTDDLLLAKQALSQLSYGPSARKPEGGKQNSNGRRHNDGCARVRFDVSVFCFEVFSGFRLVGLGRFELPTSRLSSARSNQLSYKPPAGRPQKTDRTRSVERHELVHEERETKTAASRQWAAFDRNRTALMFPRDPIEDA